MTKDQTSNLSQPIIVQNNTNLILVALLKEKGLKQTNLANLLGVDKSYVNRIVNNKERVPVSMMIRIAKILGVDSRVVFPEKSKDVVVNG